MKADIDLDIGRKTFASGLLPELIAALGRSRPGDLVAVVGDEESIGSELETWCRFTGNPLLEATLEEGRARWVFRCGAVPLPAEDNRPVGSRLWLYTNFDCNLSCDYCCVRSSPKAPRRELGLGRVQRIADEAAKLGVKEIFRASPTGQGCSKVWEPRQSGSGAPGGNVGPSSPGTLGRCYRALCVGDVPKPDTLPGRRAVRCPGRLRRWGDARGSGLLRC